MFEQSLKQTKQNQLFKDISWNLPENKLKAGKYLIIGGSEQSFQKIAITYEAFKNVNLGEIKFILPSSLQKYFKVDPILNFSPSSRSGSFGLASLDELINYADWADVVLLAGDLSKNSETHILMDRFLTNYKSNLIINSEILDLMNLQINSLIYRDNTVVISNLETLQKIISKDPKLTQHVIKLNSSLANTVDTLGQISLLIPNPIITKIEQNMIVLYRGRISISQRKEELTNWENKIAPMIAIYYYNNPNKIFEALTDAIYAIL